jgi:hypothetical protein
MIEIVISCDMSQTFAQRMNSDPKQKRERFQKLTQKPKVKTGKVFAADLRKSQPGSRDRAESAWPFAHWANAVFFGLRLALSKSQSRSARSQEADTALSLSDDTTTDQARMDFECVDRLAAIQVPEFAAFDQSRPTRHGAHRALPLRHSRYRMVFERALCFTGS